MVKCPHTAAGCNYPEGDCPGHCSVNNGLRQHRPEARRLAKVLEANPIHPQVADLGAAAQDEDGDEIKELQCRLNFAQECIRTLTVERERLRNSVERLHAESERLKSLCRRSLQALWEEDFPSLRDELRKALGDISD